MSDFEILALNSDQVQTLIELEAAEEGIRFLDAPVEPPEVVMDHNNSKIVYTVGGFSTLDSDFARELEAYLTANLDKLVRIDYDWSFW